MIRVSVKSDFDRFDRMLTARLARQLPFATAAALTDTAKAAKSAVVGAMPATFDRPTPFTKNGLVVVAATKANLSAAVRVKDIQAKYLALEETGGTRDPSMTTGGAAKALVVPEPKNLKLNAYGNIPKGLIKRIIQADAQRELTARQQRRKGQSEPSRAARDKGYFYIVGHGPGGRGPGGVFKRLPNHQYQRLVSFVDTERFKPRFGYRAQIVKAAKANFNAAMKRRLREAIATARD